MIRRFLALPLPALLAASPCAAQTEEDTGVWINSTIFGGIGSKGVFFAEVQPRFLDNASRLDQLLLRPAIGLKVTEKLSLYQGYAYVLSRPENARERREHRSFQQIQWSVGRIGPVDVASRTRIEQRWLEDGQDTGWRLRQMVRLRLPLRHEGKGVALLASAEPFVALNDTDWGARGGFDQLRSFAGVEVPLAGKSTAELGYLNQWIDRGGGRHRVNQVASVSLFWRP